MLEFLVWLFCWVNESALVVINNSHKIFWNDNELFFVVYIVSLTTIFSFNEKKTRTSKLLASFSLITLLVICYNPLFHSFLMIMPQTNDAVYGRIWIFLPVWMVICVGIVELTDRVKSYRLKNSLCITLAILLVLLGSSMSVLGYYRNSLSAYKVNADGIAIADKLLSKSEEAEGVLMFINVQEGSDSFVRDGTSFYAIKQYTGNLNVIPIYYDEQMWNDYYLSDVIPDGETQTIDYINESFNLYRRRYDFSYVVMPKDSSLRVKMEYCGYQFFDSVSDMDIYMALPKWSVQSFTKFMDSGNKVYLISDNQGHNIVIGGGNKTDRKQLLRLMYYCGNHVDVWIATNPSAESLEGLNSIITIEGYSIDKVYMPAFDYETIPDGYMNDDDRAAYEELLSNSDEGLFEICYLTEGDELCCYGISFQVLSDALDIQSGNALDNSMLLRMKTCKSSMLFCSCIGYEQGQVALLKYGEELNSDYVQIASGSGTGLGQAFYEIVNPDIAFCDSIRDDAGRQTYDTLIALGIPCYCIENGDPSMVMLE